MRRHKPSPVRHLVWCDLQTMPRTLALWLAVLALQSLVIWMGPPTPVVGASDAAPSDAVAIVVRLAMTVVMVASIIHRHRLVGTTVFWRTRPIPRAALLGATLLVLGLVAVVVPFAWFVGTFMALGLNAGTAVGGAAAIALEQTIVAAVAWVLASVSANMAQLVVGMIGTLVATAVSAILIQGPSSPKPFSVTIGDGSLIDVALLLMAAVALVLLAAHQHLTLKTRRSLVLALVFLVVSVGFMRIRPWRVVPVSASAAIANRPLVAPGTIDLASLRRQGGNQGYEEVVAYSAIVRSAAADPGTMLRPVGVSAALTFPAGSPLTYEQPDTIPWHENVSEPGGEAGQPFASMRAALGTSLSIPDGTPGGEFRPVVLAVQASAYGQASRQPGELSVRLQCEARRFVAAGVVSSSGSHRTATLTGALTFEEAAVIPDGVSVTLSETSVFEWIAREDRAYYALRNRARRQAVLLGEVLVSQHRTTMLTSRGLGVTRKRLEATFPGDPMPRNIVTEEWLKSAELVWLRPQVVGRAEWTTRVPGFTLAPAVAGAAKSGAAGEAK